MQGLIQTIWAWITDHMCSSNKIGHANKYYIIGEGRAKIAADISHIAESTGIAQSDKSTSFTSVMQSDVSRQFLWPIAFVVHRVGRSDCIAAADVEANFYLDKNNQPAGFLSLQSGPARRPSRSLTGRRRSCSKISETCRLFLSVRKH